MLLELANGAVVDAESFVNCQYGYDVRCEVVGSTGTVALDNPRTTMLLGDGRRGEAVPPDWGVRFGQAYADELQAWIGALAGGATLAPGGVGRLGRVRRHRRGGDRRRLVRPARAHRGPARRPARALRPGGPAVKIALDPWMIRSTPLLELPALVAEQGYEYIELSPREDFMPFFLHPRADRHSVAAFKRELDAAGVRISSVLPLYRWSGPDEDERQAAVRYWKRAIQITVDLGCDVMNSEFNGRPEQASLSEAQWWKSMEELLPVFEREGVHLRLEPHPDDFVEDGLVAVDMVRGVDSPLVSFLYCAPHTFHQGGNMAQIMEYAGDLLTQVHVADSFDHRVDQSLHPQPARHARPDPPAPGHRAGRGRLGRLLRHPRAARLRRRDETIMTACVFAWEDRARESNLFMREQIRHHTKTWA